MTVVTLGELLDAGVHFGHQASRWNPKMFTALETMYRLATGARQLW